MKKVILFLLPLLFGACSNDGERPIIKVEKLTVYIDGKMMDYAGRLEELPLLDAGNVVSISLSLDGNGSELQSFSLQNDAGVKTKLGWKTDEVSSEGNLTDAEKGQLRFKDGMSKATVFVQATLKHADENGNAKLFFYLSSKADREGAQEGINLKIRSDK